MAGYRQQLLAQSVRRMHRLASEALASARRLQQLASAWTQANGVICPETRRAGSVRDKTKPTPDGALRFQTCQPYELRSSRIGEGSPEGTYSATNRRAPDGASVAP